MKPSKQMFKALHLDIFSSTCFRKLIFFIPSLWVYTRIFMKWGEIWHKNTKCVRNAFSSLIKWHRRIIWSSEKPFSLIKLFISCPHDILLFCDLWEVKRSAWLSAFIFQHWSRNTILSSKHYKIGNQSHKKKLETCRLCGIYWTAKKSHKVRGKIAAKWKPKCFATYFFHNFFFLSFVEKYFYVKKCRSFKISSFSGKFLFIVLWLFLEDENKKYSTRFYNAKKCLRFWVKFLYTPIVLRTRYFKVEATYWGLHRVR